MNKQSPPTFSLSLDEQDMIVTFTQPSYCVRVGYGHLEFRNPHKLPRRIPVSETGYRSHFFSLSDLDAFDSIEIYALEVAKSILDGESSTDAEESPQLSLF